MKAKYHPRHQHGLTLIELTVVIVVLVGLTSMSIMGVSAYSNWSKGRQAGEILREVYAAQKLYLSDNPTITPANITSTLLLPYMQGYTIFPEITALDGSSKTITVTVMPPTIQGNYDPSGNTKDNIWDVGE